MLSVYVTFPIHCFSTPLSLSLLRYKGNELAMMYTREAMGGLQRREAGWLDHKHDVYISPGLSRLTPTWARPFFFLTNTKSKGIITAGPADGQRTQWHWNHDRACGMCPSRSQDLWSKKKEGKKFRPSDLRRRELVETLFFFLICLHNYSRSILIAGCRR